MIYVYMQSVVLECMYDLDLFADRSVGLHVWFRSICKA